MSNVKAVPLYEGTFSVGIDKVFRRIGRADSPGKGALKLSINPFLIDSDDRKVLFDAGLGELFGGDTTIETILDNLENHSISDYEIDDIFISHLHFDHIGGLANRQNGYWELTFPDADIWVSEDAWKKLYSLIDRFEDHQKEFYHFLDSRAEIKFSDTSNQPYHNIRVEHIGGHTEFHRALYFDNGDDRYLMAGDVIGTRGTINRNYAAKYDFNPKESMDQRKRLQKLAYDKGYVIMAYHETDHPLFKLTEFEENKGYKIENII